MESMSDRPGTLIVVARDQASFYEFLKPRQEATGRARVVLDRRLADRRSRGAVTATLERRKGERRLPTPDATRALMTVLGFMVLHPGEERAPQPGVTGASRPPVRKPGSKAPGRPAPRTGRGRDVPRRSRESG